ncbi:RluA family pseudouridine synthase [Dethiothermospora halolimnae]|uniref:RluA family pseudouridine synthase n=1 Tax=Dethiothermospora halolimnae TaxID=3114390 RepID=UPI003CCC40F5
MNEITINTNEKNQRIDRFLKKYMPEASKGFIYKMLRKKRIKLNNKRAKPNINLKEGDKIQFYMSTETINKFKEYKKVEDVVIRFKVTYEDENIIIINKPKGLLSHSAGNNENTVVKQLISYLHKRGEYDPEKEKTFIPAICNRLDKNTSGIIIGAKNNLALQSINESIRNGNIDKYYKCIVKGKVATDKELKGYLIKEPKTNKVDILGHEIKGSKKIHTKIKILNENKNFTMLEIELLTGRTHQIRAHLASIGHPIIGDLKYGDKKVNKYFLGKYKLENQFLHAYKIVLNGLDGKLDYLNNKKIVAPMDTKANIIKEELFGK